MEVKLTDKQLELVERAGLMMESSGLQPAASRILGLLIVSDKIELTFDEIRQMLNLSKSATSNALNLLLTIRKVEFITKPGDRKRYFRSNIGNWKSNITEKFEEMNRMQLLFREILEQRTPDTPEFNARLEEMINLSAFIINEIPGLIERWKEFKTKK